MASGGCSGSGCRCWALRRCRRSATGTPSARCKDRPAAPPRPATTAAPTASSPAPPRPPPAPATGTPPPHPPHAPATPTTTPPTEPPDTEPAVAPCNDLAAQIVFAMRDVIGNSLNGSVWLRENACRRPWWSVLIPAHVLAPVLGCRGPGAGCGREA